MTKRYPALQTISFLFKLLAIFTIVLGIIHLIGVILVTAQLITYQIDFLPAFVSTLPFALIPLFLSLLFALILWAFSELIICLVDIEYNTRQSIRTSSTSATSRVTNIPSTNVNPNQPTATPNRQSNTNDQSITQVENLFRQSKSAEKSGSIHTNKTIFYPDNHRLEEPSKPKAKRSIPLKAILKKIINKKLW
jgi:hypothetical protein